MTDTKISDLSAVTDVLATDEFVLARGGTTKNITGASLSSEIGGPPAPGETVPGSPSALDDEFDDSSLDGKWSWLNQGGATFTEYAGCGVLAVPAASNNSQWHGLEQTVSGSFDLTARIVPHLVSTSATEVGLFARDTSGGKLWIAELLVNGSAPSARVAKWNSASSFSATIGNVALPSMPWYLRMTSNGTTLTAFFSFDGMGWIQYSSEAIATFQSAVTRLGFAINSSQTTYDVAASIYWFRKA